MIEEIHDFVNWVRRRAPEAYTWRSYRYDLRHFLAHSGDCPPAAIQFADIDDFVNAQVARVHNHTVAGDYYKAMAVIKKRLALAAVPAPEEKKPEVTENELLTCVEALQASGLDETQQGWLAVLARGLQGRMWRRAGRV